MKDHGQLYVFGDGNPWTPRDFEESAQRFIDYFQRHFVAADDSSDPRNSDSEIL